jgi:signal transduction histidine kinase
MRCTSVLSQNMRARMPKPPKVRAPGHGEGFAVTIPTVERPNELEDAAARIADLETAVEKRDRELAILSVVAARVHGEEDTDAILRIALDEILTRLDLKCAWVFLGEQGERRLRLAAHRGVSAAYLEEIRDEGLGECLCPEVFWSGHRMQARNTTQCPRMPHIVEGLAAPVAHACVPLRFESSSRGVLNVAARPGEQFSEDELAFLETLGHQICLAIERAGHLQAERRLYRESRQAYRELQSAQARIIQTEKMAVLGTFASGLAHEVRNPLNSITLQLSILERRAAPLQESLAVEIRGLTGIIREEIKRLDSLVGDFLQFSRTSRIQYQPADLGALMDEVVRLLRPEARTSGVTLRRQRFGDPLPTVSVDSERIKQVLINLLRNAIEAMPDGGVVTAEEGLLDGKAGLVIRDSGPGLPEGLDVFQLFVTTKPKGTGLGLAIAQQIVLEHGGEIAAATDPGGGARFTIALPLSPSGDVLQETSS